MAGFLYFIANVTEADLNKNGLLDRAILKAKGLDDVLSDVVQVPAHASLAEVKRLVGPGGNVGVVLAPVSKHYGVPELVTFDPDRQKWFDRGNGVWIGITDGKIPGSQALERWQLITGYEVKDPSTQVWIAPICRSPKKGYQYGGLRQTYRFDPSGCPLSSISSDHRCLWELSGVCREFYSQLFNPPDNDATPEEKAAYVEPDFLLMVGYAVSLLAANYRLGMPEINVLAELGRDVLTNTTVHAICQASFDIELLVNAKKKPVENTTSQAAS